MLLLFIAVGIDMYSNHYRPKRQLLMGVTALLGAVGWVQSNMRMNGLEAKIDDITDVVKKVGATVLDVQNNVIAVMNATQNTHRELVTVAKSLLKLQDMMANNYHNTRVVLTALEQQERDTVEYNVRMNHWRNLHARYFYVKQRHDAYMNAAVQAMRGGRLDMSIIDAEDLWRKLEIVKQNLSSKFNYQYTFGDDVFQAFAAASVHHVTSDSEGDFCIVLSLRAYIPEKFDLLTLNAYPFPIVDGNGTIVGYKQIELANSHIAIISDKDQPNVYTLPGRLIMLSADRWTDSRPDTRLVYAASRTCESSVAFEDELHASLCLLQAKAVSRIQVHPKYSVSDKHWMFTGVTRRLVEICDGKRMSIKVEPLMIVEPKCGCQYLNDDDSAFYHDNDNCKTDALSLQESARSLSLLPTSYMVEALKFLVSSPNPVNNFKPLNFSWVPDIEKIIMGQTSFDGTMAQMIRHQTLQAQLNKDTLDAFGIKTIAWHINSYHLYILGGALIIIMVLSLIIYCQCRGRCQRRSAVNIRSLLREREREDML